MAFTDAQKASIRFYLGWTARWGQVDSELEMAMSAVGGDAEASALITNSLDSDPPGVLASIKDIDEKLTLAHGRLKAGKVGSILLNPGEMDALRQEGRRHVGRLANLLGVSPWADVFSGSGTRPDNYVGV